MNSDFNTDDFFRDRLEQFSSSVPSNMWDRIMKKRDRKIFLFRLWFSAFLIFVIGFFGSSLLFKFYTTSPRPALTSKSVIKSIDAIPNQVAFLIDNPKKDSTNAEHSKANYCCSAEKADPDEMPNIRNPFALERRKSKTRHFVKMPNPPTQAIEDVTPVKMGEAKSFSFNVSSSFGRPEKNSFSNRSFDSISHAATDYYRKKPEKVLDSSHRKWSLDLYISPDFPILVNNQTINTKLSYSFGIKINRVLSKHITVKTGIQCSRINLGADSLSDFHLSRLEIPVIAGYTLGEQSLRATFNVGATVNLLTWSGGAISPDYFRKNTGLGLYYGINLEKKINAKVSIFCEPYYRHQLTSMTNYNGAQPEFIHVAGMTIGGRYFFK